MPKCEVVISDELNQLVMDAHITVESQIRCYLQGCRPVDLYELKRSREVYKRPWAIIRVLTMADLFSWLVAETIRGTVALFTISSSSFVPSLTSRKATFRGTLSHIA